MNFLLARQQSDLHGEWTTIDPSAWHWPNTWNEGDLPCPIDAVIPSLAGPADATESAGAAVGDACDGWALVVPDGRTAELNGALTTSGRTIPTSARTVILPRQIGSDINHLNIQDWRV